VWKQGGVAGTDIADIFDSEWNKCTQCYGQKRDMLDRRLLKDMKKVELEQGSPEWHQFRMEGVGGSEVSVLLNANPYKKDTVENLFKLKTGSIEQKSENPDMRRGKDAEPLIREMYENLMGWRVPPCCVIDENAPYMRVSLDGLRDDDRLVAEFKAPRLRGQATVSAEGVPKIYLAQVQYQLLITGAEVAHFVSYCTEMADDIPERLIVLEVRPNPRIHDILRTRVREFWDFVLRRESPPLEWINAVKIDNWN
jgi:putative phage-type endonuclease